MVALCAAAGTEWAGVQGHTLDSPQGGAPGWAATSWGSSQLYAHKEARTQYLQQGWS